MKKTKLLYFIVIGIIFLMGLFLRLKGYVANPSMWHDECALAWNIKFKSYADYFSNLRFLQVAPPLFMVLTKLVSTAIHSDKSPYINDLVMRFIPLLASIASMFAFYFLCNQTLKKKFAIIVALLLFAINANLISYSYEFKPYMTDVLCTILLYLAFIRTDFSKLSYKKTAIFSVMVGFLIWFSIPTIFIISAFILVKLLKREDIKKVLIFIFTVGLSALLYLNIYVINTYAHTDKFMHEFWQTQFVLPNFSNFLYLFANNINYLFYPIKNIFFVIILLILGSYIFYREKKSTFINLSIISFFALIVASIFKFYPFSQRLIIFLIPAFLIIICKPIDIISKDSKFKSGMIIILLATFMIPQIVLAKVLLTVNSKEINKGDFSRGMMEFIANNMKKDDIIFINDASIAQYFYYSSFYKINNEEIVGKLSNKSEKDKRQVLNGLSRGNYWMFLPYEYPGDGDVIKFITSWADKKTKVYYKKPEGQGCLLYLTKNKN